MVALSLVRWDTLFWNHCTLEPCTLLTFFSCWFQEDCYVLPLRWCGLPVRMSCPLRPSTPNPPMVTCHTEGMVVKTDWTLSVAKIKVKCKLFFFPLISVYDKSTLNKGTTCRLHCPVEILSHCRGPCVVCACLLTASFKWRLCFFCYCMSECLL